MVTFIEEGHIYLNSKGKQIPSVSKLVDFAMGDNPYKDVDKRVLEKKAQYGTRIHALLEEYVSKGGHIDKSKLDVKELIAVDQFTRLMSKYCFYVKNMEQQVDYKELYGGRYDLLTQDNILIDFKTYASIDDEKLERFSWQLGFYYLALRIEQDKGYIMWLPKGKVGKVIEVPAKSWRECIDCLEQYLHPQRSLFL